MSEKAEATPLLRPIPPAVTAAFAELELKSWSDWTAPVVLTQRDVDAASDLFDDRNNIHSANFPYPVVQGALALGSIPRYLGNEQSLLYIPDYAPVMRAIREVKYHRFVAVGAPVEFRYQLHDLNNDSGGPYTGISFEIRLYRSKELAVSGEISLWIMPIRQIRVFAQFAHRSK
jgi:hypothetical protein